MIQTALDIDFVRSQFPIFKTEDGQQIAFFDNAGGSYPAQAVVDTLTEFYTQYKVQPYGFTRLTQRAGEAMDHGRQTMAELLNVNINEVTIGPSATQNLNTLAQACLPLIRKGGEVIVTEQDHEAHIGGWERLCRQENAPLHFWKVDPQSGELHLDGLEALLNENTAVVCVTHSSNIIGTINPINAIAERVHAHGARLVVDGVSYAPHAWPNLDELKVDAYVFSTYKTYGTHLGVMVVRPDFLEELTPQCHFFNEGYAYKRLDGAGPNHAAIAALSGIGDYFETVYDHHFAAEEKALHLKARQISHLMHQHENEMGAQLLETLRDLPVRIYGRNQMQQREANFSMRAEGVPSGAITKALGQRHIAAKNSHFYAYRLMQAMQVPDVNDGVLRLSLSHYNTMAEVERCGAALREILG